MNEIIMENCKCVCEQTAGKVAEEVAKNPTLRSLEIGLLILVVVLVIVALIIRFSKLKGDKDDDDDDSNETYY